MPGSSFVAEPSNTTAASGHDGPDSHYAPTMSWVVVVALLVIFVIRTGYFMANRQRLRAQTWTTSPGQNIVNPAQGPGTEPPQAAGPAPRWHRELEAPVETLPEWRGAVSPQTVPPAETAVPPLAYDTASDDTEVPTTLALTPDLEAKVREMMDAGFEAGAVRLICDELGVGILTAQQTARTVAGLATP